MQQTEERSSVQPTLQKVMAQPLLLGCVALLMLVSTLFVGLAIGFGLGRFSQTALASSNLLGSGNGLAQGRPARASEALQGNFDLFWEALDLVYRDYYGEIPDGKELTYSAIRGVLSELGDPNTSFMTPEEANFFRSSMEGSFEGIGARVDWDVERDTVRIVEPFENQPAWNAGLRRGDLILAVDGESVVGTNLNDAIQKIRGEKDTEVTLTIERVGEAAFDVTLKRARIETPTISTDSLGENGEIAYVRLYSFNQNAGQLVRQAVNDALKRNPRALIFDLRGNTGGLLRQAVLVASIFMEDQTVLLERFASGKTETYRTEGRSAVKGDLPIVVLVNEGSASASEIVAGALQDSGRAHLVGVTTFGKGSVQLPHTLSDGSIMRVTIARWYTPLDRSIDGTGLQPDTVVELTEEDRTGNRDPQLEAAVDYLEQQMK
jgi:carboxyl-terminal processing protease